MSRLVVGEVAAVNNKHHRACEQEESAGCYSGDDYDVESAVDIFVVGQSGVYDVWERGQQRVPICIILPVSPLRLTSVRSVAASQSSGR